MPRVNLPPWAASLPLSVKLLMMFGAAVTLIGFAALVPPWLRMRELVEAGQRETARELLTVWLDQVKEPRAGAFAVGEARIVVRSADTVLASPELFPDAGAAARAFRDDPDATEHFRGTWEGWSRRYVLAIPRRDPDGGPELVVLLERRSTRAGVLLAVNTLTITGAALVVLALALTVFGFIVSRLVLRPVRTLRDWAEHVREGDLDATADISTGDEFEQLAATCNLMLAELRDRQRRLSAINAALDVKLNELSEANESLDRSARLKGEFLARVSHELRTPLNAIIGFAELLTEIARAERNSLPPDIQAPAELTRRLRYLDNIVDASRGLLELIEGLLEMARIEAGKVELRIGAVDVVALARGLVGLVEPLAAKKGVAVTLRADGPIPSVRTDSRKLQQVLFNLISNAVKFTNPTSERGRPGQVEVRVERLAPAADDPDPSVRVSVIDNGPGIAPEHQEAVFESFHQLGDAHTRSHGGTGLGLAICKELSALLRCDLQLVSEPGVGSMFSVVIPLRLDDAAATEAQLEARFRVSLAGRPAPG